MLGRLVVAIVALLLAGCASEEEPVPGACLDRPEAILRALAAAPGAVALADGTRLSSCVSRARTDSELQTLGLAFMRVADTLRAQAASNPDAALRLGYLAGAVTTGAASSSGSVAAQLARRVQQVAALERGAGAGAVAALRRGLRAGASGG
jgi:hypothetical protein